MKSCCIMFINNFSLQQAKTHIKQLKMLQTLLKLRTIALSNSMFRKYQYIKSNTEIPLKFTNNFAIFFFFQHKKAIPLYLYFTVKTSSMTQPCRRHRQQKGTQQNNYHVYVIHFVGLASTYIPQFGSRLMQNFSLDKDKNSAQEKKNKGARGRAKVETGKTE